MEESLVSILIPAYNAEEWIAETIRSALAQTWGSKEIIVVDDGSTDRTLALARQFESSFVQVVSQSNRGAAAARNTAYSLCRGAYIQWLDADDLLAPDKIAKQMAEVGVGTSRPPILSGAWGTFMYRPWRARFTPTPLWCDLSVKDFLLRKLTHRIYMQTAVWLVSREVTEAAGPWDSTLTLDDDGEYFCRVLLAGSSIRFVPAAKVYYRDVSARRLSYVGHSNTKMQSLWLSMQRHISYLCSLEDSVQTRAACLRYLQNYALTFHPFRSDIIQQMRLTACLLGGDLEEPALPWKYSWIKNVLGWRFAKGAQLYLPRLKWSFIRFCDKLLARLDAKEVLNSGMSPS